MSLQSNFEYLCRICAINTKGKNSVAECVYILKTAGLKDKIERYLYLSINEDDFFPKVLCKTCFRQVEATASLSNIAQKTQEEFRNFLLSAMPKRQQQQQQTTQNYNNNNNNNNNISTQASNYQRQTAATASIITGKVAAAAAFDEFRPIVLSKAPETTITLAPPEVVISLTKKNNETRPRTKNTAIQQRRNSVFDTRYINAPVTIAQRPLLPPPPLSAPKITTAVPAALEITATMKPTAASIVAAAKPPTATATTKTITAPKPLAAIPTAIDKTSTNNSSNAAKNPSAAAGVINFIQTHGKITGSTNGYGMLNNMPSSILQQKQRKLNMALNNIKAVNSGQVSLLKPQQARPKPNQQEPQTTRIKKPDEQQTTVTTLRLNKHVIEEPSCIEECLPENIIIASPKLRKKEDGKPTVDAAVKQITERALKQQLVNKLKLPTAASASASHLKQQQSAPPPLNKYDKPLVNHVSSLTEGISLGSVIRDPDLLKLILKALQWPVNLSNFEEQMSHLKNSKFTDIMSDSKLLRDTDVTQLLGPYIGPVLMAVQTLQQQQQKPQQAGAQKDGATAATEKSQNKKSNTPPATQTLQELAANNDLASAIPYKLPPETSVQLVPSSPTEQQEHELSNSSKETIQHSRSNSSARNQRKTRMRDTSSLIISPEKNVNDLGAIAEKANAAQMNIHSLLLSQYAQNLSANDTSLAILGMMPKQQTNTKANSSGSQRAQRRRRRSTSPSMTRTINLEDIVLVEPEPELPQETTTTIVEINTKEDVEIEKTAPTETVELPLAAFKLPAAAAAEEPVITRPIIKRRKTVIQSSKTSTALNTVADVKLKVISTKKPAEVPQETSAPMPKLEAKAAITVEVEKPIKEQATVATATTEQPIETPQLPTSTTTISQEEEPEPSVIKAATEMKEEESSESIATPAKKPTATTSTTAAETVATNVSSVVTSTPTTTTTTTKTATTKETTETASANTSYDSSSNNSTPNTSNTVENKSNETTTTTTTTATAKPKKSVKSALGQQLLQAIGLQKIDDASSADARNSLRSALKRSLKQAQEQQLKRHKQEEPIKQQADSTTKNVTRESVDDEKPKEKSEPEQTKRNRNKEIKTEAEVVQQVKEEKSETPNVSSSDMTPRRGRTRKCNDNATELKPKIENDAISLLDDKTDERWDDDDDLPLKQEIETSSSSNSRSSSRPTRTSKTNSKYYKSPESGARSRSLHVMGTRATRSRT